MIPRITKLTRRKAWLRLRRNFRRYSEGKETVDSGMCHQAHTLQRKYLITLNTYWLMIADIRDMRPLGYDPNTSLYFWPCNKAGAKKRVEAITKLLKTIK